MCELAGGFLVGADQYMSQNFVVPGAGKVTMTFTPADGGREQSYDLFDFQVRDSRPSQLRPPLRMCCALDIFFSPLPASRCSRWCCHMMAHVMLYLHRQGQVHGL